MNTKNHSKTKHTEKAFAGLPPVADEVCKLRPEYQPSGTTNAQGTSLPKFSSEPAKKQQLSQSYAEQVARRLVPTGPAMAMDLYSEVFKLKNLNGKQRCFGLTVLVDRFVPYIAGCCLRKGPPGDEEKKIALFSVRDGLDERYLHHEHSLDLIMPLPRIIFGDFPHKVATSMGITVVGTFTYVPPPYWAEAAFGHLVGALKMYPSEAAREILGLAVARWNMERFPEGFVPDPRVGSSLAEHVNWKLLQDAKSRSGTRAQPHEIESILLPRVQSVRIGDRSVRVNALGANLEYLPMGSNDTHRWLRRCGAEGFYDPRSIKWLYIRDRTSHSLIPCRLHPKEYRWADTSWDEVADSQKRLRAMIRTFPHRAIRPEIAKKEQKKGPDHEKK